MKAAPGTSEILPSVRHRYKGIVFGPTVGFSDFCITIVDRASSPLLVMKICSRLHTLMVSVSDLVAKILTGLNLQNLSYSCCARELLLLSYTI